MKLSTAFFFVTSLAACGVDSTSTSEEGLSVPAASSELVAGARVKVRFDASGGRGAVAERVVIDEKEPKDTSVGKVRGALEAIDASRGTLTVLGFEGLIKPDTKLKGVDEISKIPLGSQVELKGARAADGTFVLKEIRVERPELVGTIEKVAPDGSAFTVLGVVVDVDASTELRRKVPKTGAEK